MDKVQLVKIMRSAGKDKRFPCRHAKSNKSHRYNLKDRRPPRWQCNNKKCKDNLPLVPAMHWIADLIIGDWVPRTAVHLPLLTPDCEVAPTPVDLPLSQPQESGSQPSQYELAGNNTTGTLQLPDVVDRLRFNPPPANRMVKHNTNPAMYSTMWIRPDGNCMFAAFAVAFGKITHINAREAAVRYLNTNYDRFAPAHPGDFTQYLRDMSKPSTWGDHLTLTALSHAYRSHIWVLRKDNQGKYHTIQMGGRDYTRVVMLFYQGDHYENIAPQNAVE